MLMNCSDANAKILEETKGFLASVEHAGSPASGGVTFTVAWSFSVVADFMRLYNDTVSRAKLQAPIFGDGALSLTNIIPPSAFGFFSGLPEFGTKESLLVALGVVMALATFKLIFIAFNWQKIKALNVADRVLREEMDYLRGWIGALKQLAPPVGSKKDGGIRRLPH